MAHGILQSLDKNISVYSGGTEPAARVNAKAVEVMKEIGIDISSHVPEFIDSEFRRVRDEIRNAFTRFYITEIRKEELPGNSHPL